MSAPRDMVALRSGVGLADQATTTRLRIKGRGTAALLDAVLSRGVPLREARTAPALILRDDGSVLADVLIVGEAGGALLLAEGAPSATIAALLRGRAPARDVEVEDLGPSHALLAIEGPFAWELLGALLGPNTLAAPFHTSFRIEPWTALGIRAGKSGEYMYHVLLPREVEDRARGQIAELAPRFELATLGEEARSLAALEQGSFDVRHGEAASLTPLELQLQWRIDYSRDAPGIAAVRALRDEGRAGRVTWCVAPGGSPPPVGTSVTLGERTIGRVIHAAESPTLNGVVGLVLLERAFAHPGLTLYWRGSNGQQRALKTVTPPLLNNRSLFVSPVRHAFARREQIVFPPLARVSIEQRS